MNNSERVQAKARDEGKSVDALVRDYLEFYAGVEERERREKAVRAMLDFSARAKSGSGGRETSSMSARVLC